jgi:chromosome segregation protein
MRVKRLEIQGFKSFKDRTVIHFDHSITGIVGPNGCGKSNIVDAFFWVMGEQSYKHMRGSGSDDLIFNGSTKYPAAAIAEATMVLETDVVDTENAPAGASAADLPLHLKAKEISVTRRVYRDGQGEYLINGVTARLKDIHELFMDTGVGAKGYSVIEQGQIGKIVNAKPEDRRLLIEEAAGIAKYKARKKESLRKMEATHGNLARLNDVIQEIERNLGSLERQAQKARQYKKYKEELLSQEMTWGRRKTRVLREQLEELRIQREAMEQELVALRAELQIAENAIEVDQVEQLTATKNAEELQTQVQSLSQELSQKQSALDLSRRRQEDLISQLTGFQTEKETLLAQILEAETRLSGEEAEYLVADETLARAVDDASNHETATLELRNQTREARIQTDRLKNELVQGVRNASDLTAKAAQLEEKLTNAQAREQELRAQVAAQESELESHAEEIKKAATALEQAQIARDQSLEARTLQQNEVQDLERALKTARTEWDQSLKTLTQWNTRLQSLRELDAAYEGFGDGPKSIIEWARSNGHDHQIKAVADAIQVQPGFEQALEGWLEGRLQNLIAEDPEIALRALESVAADKKGRASIHVAPEMPRGTTDFGGIRSLLESSGFTISGDLSQFVTIKAGSESSVTRIAQQLTAHVCVVDSFAPVANFVRSGKSAQLFGWSLVSLDGSVLDSQGILRGGSTESGQIASVLGRKRAIQELEAQTLEQSTLNDRNEQQFILIRDSLESAQARLEEIRVELSQQEISLAQAQKDHHQQERILRDAQSAQGRLQDDLDRALGVAQDARAQSAAVQEDLAAILERRSVLEEQISTHEQSALDLQEQLQESERLLQELKVREASLKERSASLGRELEANRSVIGDRKRRLQEVERNLVRSQSEQDQFSGGDTDLEARIGELHVLLTDQQLALSQAKQDLETLNAKTKGNLDRIRELHSVGGEKTQKSGQVAIDQERLSGELSHLIQNLEEKYGVGCLEQTETVPVQEEMSGEIVTREMTAEEEQLLGEEVERLRERIRRLGEVNVMAIEEYEETQKRYEHILGEKRDLESSIQNLQDAIDHINKTSEERFRKAFESIADRFQRLFPIIFGGGSAQLSLVYPEGSNDILDAGVDILAQPPGKKVSNITLLSGGEKALTAVSLIFAIFMVKPSPFCVLDEVDAPLDDANIGKFNALLREMSIKSQFILITHNKKTMELNDTLYGVTMEEPGVSKMVSIELH